MILREYSSDKCKEWVARSIGYVNLITLLTFTEDQAIIYDVFQLINLICENNSKN
jgi:hypothetical protein